MPSLTFEERRKIMLYLNWRQNILLAFRSPSGSHMFQIAIPNGNSYWNLFHYFSINCDRLEYY
jgi:hypothetical protein